MRTEKFSILKFAFSLIILFHLFTSCQSSFENRLRQKIVNDSKTHYKVLVSLKDLTNFEWDRVFVFNPGCSPDDLKKALGSDYPYYKDNCRILVFLKNGKIVFHEENSKKQEDNSISEIVFFHEDSLKYCNYRIGEAYFQVEVKKNGKNSIFELNQLK